MVVIDRTRYMAKDYPIQPHTPRDGDDSNANPYTDLVESFHGIEIKSEIESDSQKAPRLVSSPWSPRTPLGNNLYKFRSQRLKELQQCIYILPMAKANLQAQYDDLFPLMKKVQEFLSSEREVMLILGDSGAGKSSFIRHLERHLWTGYKRGRPIHLYINLALMDHSTNNLIEKQLQYANFSKDKIQEMKLHRQFIVICDGYDESQLKGNIHTTNQFNQPGQFKAKVVICCRSEYLGPEYRSRFQPQSVDQDQSTRPSLFQEAVIAPFSKDQVQEYVTRYASFEPRTWVAKDYMRVLIKVPNLMDLVKNPFLLMLALKAMPVITKGKKNLSTLMMTRVQLYDIFIVQWLDVNKRRLESNALSSDDRLVFDELKGAGFTFMGVDYLTKLARAIFEKQNGKPAVQYHHLLDHDTWKVEFFGQEPEARLLLESCPLARSGSQFFFLHQSMLEYFFSRVICSPVKIDEEDIGLLIETSSSASLSPDGNGPFFQRDLLLEPSIVHFLCDRAKSSPSFEQQLRAVIDQSKTEPGAIIAATNAITILVKAGRPFHGANLRGIKVPGADLSNGQFDSAQFQGADLSRVNLSRCWLRQADLSSAQMEDVQFEELPYLEMEGSVYACAYSPDGGMLAVGFRNDNAGICIYDTSSWTRTRVFSGTHVVRDVAFSPDGKSIISGGDDGIVRLWNCTNGQEIFVMEGNSECIKSVTFSPCGKQIASAYHDGIVRLWDSQTGERLFLLEGHTGWVTTVRYSPNGQQLVSGSEDGTIRFWNPETGEIRIVLRSSLGAVHCLAYSPDGQRIVSGHYNDDLQLWDTVHGEPGPVLQGHTNALNGITFSPKGEWIASSCWDETVRLWDASTGALVSTLSGHSANVTCVAFSPDGLQIASGGWDNKMRLWDMHPRSSTPEDHAPTGHVLNVAYSLDSQTIFSVSGLGLISRNDPITGLPGPFFELPDFHLVQTIALSPDGNQIAIANDRGPIRLWNLQTGVAGRVLKWHSGSVSSIAFSPCCRWIVFADWNMTVWLWDLDNTDQRHVLSNTNAPIQLIIVSPDGFQIAMSSTTDGTVYLLDRLSGELLSSINLEDDEVWALAYSPIDQQLAIGTSDKTVHLWDLHSDQPVVSLKGHDGYVDCIAYSPCGQWIASGSHDMSVRLWHCQQANKMESWSCVSSVHGFFDTVSDIAWSPVVPMEFVTACWDGSVRVWQVSSSDGGVVIELLWGTNLRILCAADLIFKNTIGLSPVNEKLLIQRGAISPIVEQDEHQ